MSKIKVMDEVLANKIAAGEVVEKIMNVVKELVENSIDASSDEITIELVDSGTKMIKVSDNGIGMDKEDAILAFSRHATSKLSSLSDLFAISSLGFRGEALPSIASVSKVVLKTANESRGTLIKIEGGHIEEVLSSDLQKGTDITVSSLFYNTPVRLKYLKSLHAELAYITDYISKMALSYPSIKFTLINNDKVLLHTDGRGNLLKVIYEIYGAEVSKKMVSVDFENDDYRISGYISYPEMARSNRNSITLLVNGRVIRNHELLKTITDCYHTYIPATRFPIVVLNILVDPILVDVNIHPTKMDVKFSKLDVLKELILTTIQAEIKKLLLIPSAVTREKESVLEVQPYIYKEDDALIQDLSTLFLENKVEDTDTYEIQESNTVYDANLSEHLEKEQVQFSSCDTHPSYKIKKMIPRGIVYETYIIAENEDGMYIIDQHAAAERINYEKCLKELLHTDIKRIPLLVPLSLEFPTHEFIMIKSNLDLLRSIGFDLDEFGINTFVIRSHPPFIKEKDMKEDIVKIFQIVAEKEYFEKDKFLHYTAATMACRMSIKGNDYIHLDEASYLLDALSQCDNPFNCPHGRPTIITYTKYDLEKMFKRVMS